MHFATPLSISSRYSLSFRPRSAFGSTWVHTKSLYQSSGRGERSSRGERSGRGECMVVSSVSFGGLWWWFGKHRRTLGHDWPRLVMRFGHVLWPGPSLWGWGLTLVGLVHAGTIHHPPSMQAPSTIHRPCRHHPPSTVHAGTLEAWIQLRGGRAVV
jgi:hypothetical protein